MKVCLFLIIICTTLSAAAQDSSQLKKRTFRIVVSDSDKVKTKGWLAEITDTTLQLSYLPVRFAVTATKTVNMNTFNYNQLAAVRIKEANAGFRGLGIGFVCGFAIGGIIGLASGDDKEGLFRATAGEKAIVGGLFAGILSAGIGAIIGALPGRTFTIGRKKENFDQLRISVLDRAYRNSN